MASVSALGANPEQVWESYLAGRARFSVLQLKTEPALVCSLQPELEEKLDEIANSSNNYKRLDRSVLLAILSARASVKLTKGAGKSLGVNLGSSRGATGLFEQYHRDFLKREKARTLASPTTTLGNISAWVAQDLRVKGISLSHSVTCATALHAVLNGIAWLNAGMSDSFLVGGSEAPLTPFTIGQMRALKLYANERREFPCRALDLDKSANTMILGESAATAILKKGYSKQAQAHIIGYGWGSESLSHHTSLSKQADCFQQSMAQALELAGLESVDAIVMHAPGTVLGDQAEINAINKVFTAKTPFLTTNKAIIGHTLGASGMMSLELAVLMLQHNKLIAPYYYKNEKPILQDLNTVMVNAVGFGGNAVSIVLKR